MRASHALCTPPPGVLAPIGGKLPARSGLGAAGARRWSEAGARVTEQTADLQGSRYDAERPLIDRIISRTASRHHLQRDDALEFRSYVWERLLAGDPLARFQRRCSLRTFLTVVIGNHYRDFCNHRWGKWRPSAEARRLGRLAVRLETLLARDGHSFDEAVEILRTNDRLSVSRAELEELSLRLPDRPPRPVASDEPLDEIAGAARDLDRLADRERYVALAIQIRRVLAAALQVLEPQDRIILKLLYEDGFTVARVSAALHLPQKALYRRRDHLLAVMRSQLDAAGVSGADVEAVIGSLDPDERSHGDEP